MKHTQERHYRAIAIKPAGWRSECLNFDDAMDAALRFVNQWDASGVKASVGVYYRDRDLAATVNEAAHNMVHS